jgi:hypothetical protein
MCLGCKQMAKLFESVLSFGQSIEFGPKGVNVDRQTGTAGHAIDPASRGSDNLLIEPFAGEFENLK